MSTELQGVALGPHSSETAAGTLSYPSEIEAATERVRHLISDAIALSESSSDAHVLPLERLRTLSARLAKGRLQLAVVGQFKRGKSTLLNALLGAYILPSAVTPLTSLPTFVRYGPKLLLVAEDVRGGRLTVEADNADQLRDLLAARVTEDGNPKNRLELSRVEIEVPAPLLANGIVLIDTPGVGSTFRHNTATAEATLPECDAALFVVSPDPPITETEIVYLNQLRAVTSTITIVLNKVDLVDNFDRWRSEQFLKRVIAETCATDSTGFFSTSARAALNAISAEDAAGLEKTGLPNLHAYLVHFAQTKRLTTLRAEVARKASVLVRDLTFSTELKIGAYQLPVSDLSARLERFRAAEVDFARERNARRDLLKGDRERLLQDLNQRAEALRKDVQGQLRHKIATQKTDQEDSEGTRVRVAEMVPRLFQEKFDTFQSLFRGQLEELLGRHQRRADELISDVRRSAAHLLEVPYFAPIASAAFKTKKTPYWVTAPRESLGAMPLNLFQRAFPKRLREQWLKRQLVLQADEIVIRNVENLRWALRQNVDEAFLKFQTELDEQLAATQRTTTLAIEEVIKRRSAREAEDADEIARLGEVANRLHAISAELDSESGGS